MIGLKTMNYIVLYIICNLTTGMFNGYTPTFHGRGSLLLAVQWDALLGWQITSASKNATIGCRAVLNDETLHAIIDENKPCNY